MVAYVVLAICVLVLALCLLDTFFEKVARWKVKALMATMSLSLVVGSMLMDVENSALVLCILMLASVIFCAFYLAISWAWLFAKQQWFRVHKRYGPAMSQKDTLNVNSSATTDENRNNISRYIKAAVITALSLVAFVAVLVFKEVLLASFVYNWWIGAVTSATRLPQGLASALTIALSSLVAFFVYPFVIRSLFGLRNPQRKQRLLIIGLSLASFLAIAHFVSQPKEGEYFNTVTGAPMWKYSTATGDIVLKPLYEKYDDTDQTERKLIDPQVVKAYVEQEKRKKGLIINEALPNDLQLPALHSEHAKEIANALGVHKRFKTDPVFTSTETYSFCNRVLYSKPDVFLDNYGPFDLWVEYVNLEEDSTTIGVGARISKAGEYKSRFHEFGMLNTSPKEYAALTDSNEMTFGLKSQTGDYPIKLRGVAFRHEFLWFGDTHRVADSDCGSSCDFAMMFFPGETYHFELKFRRLATYWPDFRLEVPHFKPIRIFFVE